MLDGIGWVGVKFSLFLVLSLSVGGGVGGIGISLVSDLELRGV